MEDLIDVTAETVMCCDAIKNRSNIMQSVDRYEIKFHGLLGTSEK